MKKLYTFIGISLLINTAICQPTFTAANFNPTMGETTNGFSFDTASFTIGTTGAGVTWNFSGLVSTGSSGASTVIDPATTPYASSFTASNSAYGSGGAYNYYLYNSTGQYQYGEASSSQLVSEYDPGTLYTFPFTYGFSSNDSLHANFIASTYPATRKGRILTTADGYGTLQLPTGTYTNVMRVTLTWTMDETIDYGFTTMTGTYIFKYHYWIKPNTHYPLLSYLQSGIDAGAGINWFSAGWYIDPAFVDVADETENEAQFALYPNPSASREIQLGLNSQTNDLPTISISNASGQVVFQKTVNVSNGFNNVSLDLRSYESGMYFVTVSTAEGKSAKKLILE